MAISRKLDSCLQNKKLKLHAGCESVRVGTKMLVYKDTNDHVTFK